jgi:oligoribonuclease (3'-5' exoribonuclease)
MASWIGAPYTLLFGGGACIIGAIFFARKLPKIERLIHPIYVKMGIIKETATGMPPATKIIDPPIE